MLQQQELFIPFFRSGILGFGGGPSAMPLVHKEVIQTFKMMTDDEFTDVSAIAVLMANLTFDFFSNAIEVINWLPTIILAVLSYVALESFKVHLALVIIVGLVVGGVLLKQNHIILIKIVDIKRWV